MYAMKLAIKIALALLLLTAVYVAGRESIPPPETVTDTISLRLAERRAERAELEADGLRSRLRGLREIPPDTVFIIRDSIAPPDTVYRYLAMDSHQRIETMRLAEYDSIRGVYTDNRIMAGIDVSRCDDGWSIGQNTELVCNTPVFGHLFAFINLGIWAEAFPLPIPGGKLDSSKIKPLAEIGLEWQKYYRSKYSLQLGVDIEGRLFGGVKRRFEIW